MSIEGKHAHHMLPWKHRDFFANAGLDINDPKYGVWMDSHNHLSRAKEYNRAWEKYRIEHPSASADEIVSEMKKLMKEIYDYDL